MKPQMRFRVFERDSFMCRYCGQKAPNVILHVDHVHPVSRGGTEHIDNLVTACSACNAGKAGSPIDPVSNLIAEQRCDALSFWAVTTIHKADPASFAGGEDILYSISDFIAGSEDPMALIEIAQGGRSWAEIKKAWLSVEGYPETFWSPSNEVAPE